MRFKNLLKPFLITTLILMIGFAGKAQLLSESFDNATFPPAGWTNVHTTTGIDPTSVWERAVAGTLGGDDATGQFTVDPHSGAGMAEFRCYDFGSPTVRGDGAYLASPSFSMVAAAPQQLSFWMHRDDIYIQNPDSVSVYINTAQNLTGATFLGTINRHLELDPVETGLPGWYRYSFAIPAGFTGANNYVIFSVTSEWGNNVFIDDVTVAEAACTGTPTAGAITAASTTVCPNNPVDLSLTGYSAAGGIALQWESSPAGANTFTALTGETNATYSGTITDATDFRVKVTCTNSNAFVYSAISTITIGGVPANDEICDAIALTIDGASDCGNTTCATTTLDEPEEACSASNNTVWYKFTPAVTGFYNVVFTNADFGARISAYSISGSCPAPTAYNSLVSCLTNVDETLLVFYDSVTLGLGSFTAGTEYYVRIDGYGGAFGSYCIALVTAPAPPTCTTNMSPANAAVNVPGPVTFSWNATAGADGYALIVGTDNPPVAAGDTLGTVTGTSVQLLGLLPNTTYNWYVVPFNSGGQATGCTSNVTSFTTAPAPANNDCANAVNLTVANGFCATPVIGDLTFADSAVGFTSPVCQPGALPWDVWYKVTVPASGNVIVQTSAVNTDVADLVMEAYSGSCAGALITCSDDDNPDFAPSAFHPRISLTGRTPGEVVYLRVMPFYDGTLTNVGPFAICAFDSTNVAPVAPSATTCSPVTVTVDSAFKYTWATFKDAAGNVIAQVYPNGNVFGNTTASYYVNSGPVRQIAGTFYLDRNVTVTPTVQPDPTVGVLTKVFFTDAELTALAAAAGGATTADLNCTKTSQTCATSATVANGGEYFDQFDNGDYGAADHFVTVLHDTYSTFYLHKGTIVLPVSLSSFNAVRAGNVNKLNWVTEMETNLKEFVVEHSTNNRDFKVIGNVAAKGNSSSVVNYNFTDNAPARALNYYRLKMVDNNGTFKYSEIRTVRNEGTADVTVSPNPVKTTATLKVSSDVQDKATITINDINGKIVYRNTSSIVAGINYIKLELNGLSAGTYVVKVQLNKDLVITKINKL